MIKWELNLILFRFLRMINSKHDFSYLTSVVECWYNANISLYSKYSSRQVLYKPRNKSVDVVSWDNGESFNVIDSVLLIPLTIMTGSPNEWLLYFLTNFFQFNGFLFRFRKAAIPTRYLIAGVAFLNIIYIDILGVNVNITIVAMVNYTAIPHVDIAVVNEECQLEGNATAEADEFAKMQSSPVTGFLSFYISW